MAEVINFLTVIFSISYGVSLVYLVRGWRSLDLQKMDIDRSVQTSVSVLIAARNEELNIAYTIQDILNQDFPPHLLEIIVVDDHSSDNTASIIQSFSDQGVKLIQLSERELLNSYKKKAITEAITHATGELIVATDADCRMGKDWLKAIVTMYEEKGLLLISGPVVYHNERTLFQRLQTLEFFYLIGLGAASIGNKNASTCNGANLAYKRELFWELGGFNGIDDLASGDDELFLHKVADKYPDRIGFCKNRKAIVYTEAKDSLGSFISQRKRWASKSTRYKNKSVVVLGVSVWLFNFLLMLSILSTMFKPDTLSMVVLCISVKIIAELVFVYPIAHFAKRKLYLALLPFLSVLHIFYIIYIGIAGNSGRYRWKGRVVR